MTWFCKYANAWGHDSRLVDETIIDVCTVVTRWKMVPWKSWAPTEGFHTRESLDEEVQEGKNVWILKGLSVCRAYCDQSRPSCKNSAKGVEIPVFTCDDFGMKDDFDRNKLCKLRALSIFTRSFLLGLLHKVIPVSLPCISSHQLSSYLIVFWFINYIFPDY
jgi:hypothetical protein